MIGGTHIEILKAVVGYTGPAETIRRPTRTTILSLGSAWEISTMRIRNPPLTDAAYAPLEKGRRTIANFGFGNPAQVHVVGGAGATDLLIASGWLG